MATITSIRIKAELVFNNHAGESFRFPINNPVRISIWTNGARYSTFSEISSSSAMLLDSVNEVNIEFPSDYLNRQIVKGDEFHVGTFPWIIGYVKVLQVVNSL